MSLATRPVRPLHTRHLHPVTSPCDLDATITKAEHQPSVTVTADGRYRPACDTDGCIDEHASNYPGVFSLNDALDYANELLAENADGPTDTDPRHSDVTRGWGLPA